MSHSRTHAVATLALLASLVAASASRATVTTYFSRTTFENSLPAGYFANDFSSVPTATSSAATSVSQSGGTPTLGYEITAPSNGLHVFSYSGARAIGNWDDGDDLVITFTSGDVHSVGATIWLADVTGDPISGTVAVELSNGAEIFVSSSSGGGSFVGLTDTGTAITTMTLKADTGGAYVAFTNLTVAGLGTTAVPGAGVTGLATLGIAGNRRRRRR